MMGRACAWLLAAAFTTTVAAAATLRVDPADPRANDERPGKTALPFRTIAAAVRQLRAGDTLSIAAGTYRETIDLRSRPDLRGITIEGDRERPASIRGSDVVEGWERVGDSLYARRHWSTPTQQLFIDGVPLQQVGGTVFGGFPDDPRHRFAKLLAAGGGIWPGRVSGDAHSMPPGSFHYDARSATLYLRPKVPSLDGRVVEASVRPYVLIGAGLSDVVVRDLSFTHSNTTAVSQAGAVTLAGSQITLDRLQVTRMDGNCVDVTGQAVIVQDIVASACGMVGLKVRGKGNRIVRNVLSHNNTRGFNKWWEAGGAKFVGDGGLSGSEVANNVVHSNHGDGLWFDWKNSDNRVHDNLVAYNEGMGIHYEASEGARISDNIVFGNGQRGIYLPNSSRSTLEGNLVFANGLEGIAIVDERRAAANGPPEFVPRGNSVRRNVIAWNGKAAIVLPDPRGDNESDANTIVGAIAPRFSLGWGSREQPVRTGLAAWQEASGQDRESTAWVAPMPGKIADALAAHELDRAWRSLVPTSPAAAGR